MVYPNELIACGGDVEVRLFLVDEERVGHPNILDELRPDGQRFNAGPLPKRQPRIRPELTEVKIQREVLFCYFLCVCGKGWKFLRGRKRERNR